MEPRAIRHLFFVAGGLRVVAEIALGDQPHFVVVVEHRASMPRHAEILQQHVAGENIVAGHVLDGLTVVERRQSRGFGFLLAQVQVQRAQAALYVGKMDDEVVALHGDAVRATGQQFIQQCRRKARARETQEAVGLRIQQAAHTIQVEDQRILVLHVLVGHGLRVGEFIADHLEYQRVAGQGEYRHDHAGGAFGMHQLFVGVAGEMAEERAEAFGLALLGAAQHGVDLVDRLVRQQRAQEYHRVAHRGQVGMEITARIAEELGHVGARGQHGLHAQLAIVVDQRDHAGREAVFTEHASDQVGTALAVEHRIQQLH